MQTYKEYIKSNLLALLMELDAIQNCDYDSEQVHLNVLYDKLKAEFNLDHNTARRVAWNNLKDVAVIFTIECLKHGEQKP